MTVQTPVGSTKVPIALHFTATDIADANGTLNSLTSTVKEYAMPVAGSVIGFGANLDGTLTTGTLTFYPTINGTQAVVTDINGTNVSPFNFGTLVSIAAQQITPGQNPQLSFNAGDTVGLMWTKAGTVAPTTRDAAAVLIVLLDGYDY